MAQERHFKVLEQNEGEVIYSESWIKDNYWPYWCQQMRRIGKQDQISFESCIEDWIIINWAEEIKP